MELELFQETVFATGIGKIQRFVWRHRHEDLHHREYTFGKDALMHIAFQLEHSLRHIYSRTLQFDME